MNNTVPLEFEGVELDGELFPGATTGSLAPLSQPKERHLRLASPRRRAGRSPLLGGLVAVGLVLVILATQLGLSIAISEGAYEVRALEIEQRDLARVERLLSQNVEKLASPQNLAENAAQLGMVQNVRPATLRLSDGVVLGSLESVTTEARGNLVPNSTLDAIPVIDSAGSLVARNTGLAGQAAAEPVKAPVQWEGKLPAPRTH
ncbi:hypothetical protein G7067_08040 [Leucobacter insecticola]|uniref:Cell division protein FtsL n=1 Tax=Leucobacter insecticola TaxID=2714934 RepID=A0A6G8FJA9_9MICO|nr:hypothetical protein [Leucobacter insecticola]QIM16383.1 hypothetical protein G7067_08040 [Leucobacter insecticola]